jgi:hypothetical protein
MQRGVARNSGARTPYTGSWRYRRPYVSPFRAGISYGVPGYGWVSPYFPGFPYDQGDDESSAAPDNSDAQPQDQDQSGPLPPYQPSYDVSRPAAAPADEEAVTLIFKDGRPPEQIHNYILTPTTLYVGDQYRRAIPTDQLDLVATAGVNQLLGVDFQVPSAR